MSNKDLEREIRSGIEKLVAEITERAREEALQSVRDALLGSGARRAPKKLGRPRKSAAGKPRRATAGGKATGKRVRRSTAAVGATADRLLAYVKANPGRGISEIARSLRLTSKDLRLPVLKLLEDKKIKTTGQRRGTKYHPAGRGGAPRKKVARKKAAKKKKRTAKKTRRKSSKRTSKKKVARKAA